MTISSLFPDKQVDCLVTGKTSEDADAATAYLNRYRHRQLIQLDQQHTNRCVLLTAADANLAQKDLSSPADAALSDRTDVVLSVRTADCLPILLYQPSGIIGAIHAGRKGTELGILQQTLLLLKAHWDVKKDVVLWFGPSICNKCYQVNREPNLRYNLRDKNKQQAESVFPNKSIQIIDSEHCTFHHNKHWYSYRKEGKGVARNSCLMCLR
jgi:YfiH family protein